MCEPKMSDSRIRGIQNTIFQEDSVQVPIDVLAVKKMNERLPFRVQSHHATRRSILVCWLRWQLAA